MDDELPAVPAWDADAWPRPGHCGACGLGAHQAPSGRWWHDGRPCRARTQVMWLVDDLDVKASLRFVATGEPLPTGPTTWHMDRTGPAAFDVCRDDHTPTVRDFLAREAQEATR